MSKMEMFIFKRYGIGYRPKHTHGTTTIIQGWGYITYMGRVEGDGWAEACKNARKILGPLGMNQGKVMIAYRWMNSGYGYVATFPKGIPDTNWPSAEDHILLPEVTLIIKTIEAES